MPKGNYKRYALVGPGGIKCPCCCTKGYKPTLKRQAKRREQRAVMREVDFTKAGWPKGKQNVSTAASDAATSA